MTEFNTEVDRPVDEITCKEDVCSNQSGPSTSVSQPLTAALEKSMNMPETCFKKTSLCDNIKPGHEDPVHQSPLKTDIENAASSRLDKKTLTVNLLPPQSLNVSATVMAVYTLRNMAVYTLSNLCSLSTEALNSAFPGMDQLQIAKLYADVE